MGISEQEALARQLYALWWESVGVNYDWEALKPAYKTAWIMVAQFVEVRSRELMATNVDAIVMVNGERYRSVFDEPDHR